jgi:RNA polymerase sigma-70 factor (ECF subfamily)
MSEFGRLLELEIPALRRYAHALTRDPTESDDLVQSCLLRALVKQQLWQPGTDLRRWLFTMLYHQQISRLRRQARERGRLAEAGRALAPGAMANPDGRLVAQEIMRAIAALPGGQREALRRVVFGEMGYAEAAEALAVPEGTLRSRLARARVSLRRFADGSPEAGTVVPFPRPAGAPLGDRGHRLAA